MKSNSCNKNVIYENNIHFLEKALFLIKNYVNNFVFT